jgi:hypothetical protein
MKTLIIQYSPCRTGSTVLANALYGLIPSLSNKNILFNSSNINFNLYKLLNLDDDIFVIKSHTKITIDDYITKYNNDYKLFFICSERAELNLLIDEKYKLYDNVIVFSFDELNESSTNTIPMIIENIYHKINNKLNIELNIENGINRIIEMNKLYEEIKDKDFAYFDKFYHLHGSHRNRVDDLK